MLEVAEIVFRAVLAFSLLIIIAHILGKETIAQMTYHDFIGAIVIGAIAGNLAFNQSIEIKTFIISLFSFTGIVYVATYLSLKNRKARAVFSGEPTVVIQEGKILEDNLKKLRFTLDSLNQSLREKDVFNIEEVEFAIVENDGHLSVLKKPPYQAILKKDMALFTKEKQLFPIELMMDGEIIEKNLTEHNLTKEWLFTEIEHRGLLPQQICYCVRGTNGKLYIDLYHDLIQFPIDVE